MLDPRTGHRNTAGALGLLLAFTTATSGCIADETILAVASDQRLAELDDDERSLVCDELRRKGAERADDPDAKHALCLLLGSLAGAFADGAPVATCEQVYDRCIRDGGEAAEGEMEDAADQCVPEAAESCTVTVAQWEECVLGSSDELIGLLSDKTCADAMSASDAMPEPGSAMTWQSSACAPVRKRCPELLSPQVTEPECSLALETTGAVDAQLTWETDLCGYLGDAVDGPAILIDAPEGAPFKSTAFNYEPREPGTREEAAAMGVTLWTPDGSAAWSTGTRDCTAVLEAAQCEMYTGEPGVRYTFTNGTCGAAATAAIGQPGGTIEVRAFSGTSACLTR